MTETLEIWDQIVGTASVNRSHGRLFCLGPNVGRISFASQQMRALNLIWALRQAGKIKENDHVGIVGAGVSGLTAAFAARAMGCFVTVVERGGQPLHRQHATTHRHVHPNINWWPSVELSPTTNFPFLNWHSGQCNLVMDLLEREWKKLLKENTSFVEFFPNENASEVSSIPADGGRLVLKTTTREIDKLDAVIVACGFGEERGLGDQAAKSYWRADELESQRSEPNAPSRFVVSGTGDGGLIDALRIAYELEFGVLTFRIAEAIDGSELAESLSRLDLNPTRAGFESLASEIDTVDSEVHKAVKNLLNDSLRRGRSRYVILADKEKADPFVHGPAPIHRLMIAYALWHGVLDYVKAEVKIGAEDIIVGDDEFSKRTTALIVRHGAKPFHDLQLIRAGEWTDLESRQRHAMDYSHKRAWGDNAYPTPAGWSCPVLDPQGFTSTIQKLALSTLRAIGSHGYLTVRADKFLVSYHDLSYRPKRLFGIDVEYQTEQDLETVDALA